MNPLQLLANCGQSPWLDYVRRSLIEKHEIGRMVTEDGLKGMTSNPSIFEKGIAETEEYNAVFEGFEGTTDDQDHAIGAIYEHIAINDIRDAADALRPVFDATNGRDGYISLEVSPYLARDTAGTIAEGRRLWQAVGKPNLMVKVPATPEGIPAIRQLIADGLNINVTLLFAVDAYEAVAEAYIAGLEDRAAAGGAVSQAASVASFFISRIDTAIDKALDAAVAKGLDPARADALRGKVAIANAKRSYASYQRLFSGPRWAALAAKGAQTQRLLWASTSSKNPAYKDTIYVEELIGRDTVNTMPPATMDAFRDHGQIKPDAIETDLASADATLAGLADAGVAIADVTTALVDDGVRLFADSFDNLLGAVARRRRERREGKTPRVSLHLGDAAVEKAVAAAMQDWRLHGKIRKLWAGDATLWTGADEAKWLGWLGIVSAEQDDAGTLAAFADMVQAGGFSDVVLLGMGGSSLGPEVLAETLGPVGGWPRFHMLDSTDPAQISALEAAITLGTSLFIVSSKSGSTLEPNIFKDFFFDRVATAIGRDAAGKHFVAVTDPGSAMEKAAQAAGFAGIFYGLKSIGGRYSVLSKFGLVPAAAIGLDVPGLLRAARGMALSCGPDAPPAENPGVQLGVAMGTLAASFGRDKVTILASPGIADLGAWLEQLLAESTGKQGHGLIPLAAEPLGAVAAYGADRFFAYLALEGKTDPAQDTLVAALEAAGHPVVRIMLASPIQIGAEFFRWEIATAIAGAVIGIDPFDQPDVEASKIKTRALTDAVEKDGALPAETPIFSQNGISLFTDPANAAALGTHDSLGGYIAAHLARIGAGDYVALLAYIARNAAHTEALQAMRARLRDHTKAATCLGFGPRFLHSTGQAYKGGPNSGVFLQITCDDAHDLAVPGARYSFGTVKAAQARGDFGVLAERGRRALRIHLADATRGLAELARLIEAALG